MTSTNDEKHEFVKGDSTAPALCHYVILNAGAGGRFAGYCSRVESDSIHRATEPTEASVPKRCAGCSLPLTLHGVAEDANWGCEVARLREALRGAQATIESMRSENKLHGHITDASAFYLHHSKPLIDAALQEREE